MLQRSEMPSKYSPRTKRPPSPYSVSQSPRTQQRVWRSLSSTGQASSRNEFAEGSREKWLRSLRQGTDSKRSPMKGNHNIHGSGLNTSLTSTPDYLREQLGLPDSTRKHKRSNSVDLSYNGSPRPMYKSPEDMYDEIISLKKNMVVMKNEYDVLKAKTRRLEEDNIRKDKYIEKLLDPKNNDENIRMLAEGNSKGGSVVTGLKQRLLKLEKQLRDKENELNIVKNDTKTTDITEMKTAMEIYYQEVLRLRDVVSSQEMRSERLSSSLNSERETVPTKIKALRKNVVQLTAENHQLVEDNQRLKRDLDKAIGDFEASSEDDDDTPIKYSALSKVELVNLIKKSKQHQTDKQEAEHARNQEETDKLKNIILKLKEEKYEFREENKALKEQNKSFEIELDKQTHKVSELRHEIEALKDKIENQSPRTQRRSSESREGRRKSIDERQKYMNDRPRKVSRSPDKNKAAASIQRQWREHRDRKKLKEEDEVIVLQSALRGHLSRQSQLKSGSTHTVYKDDYGDVLYSSDSESDVVYLQSALRGHIERRTDS